MYKNPAAESLETQTPTYVYIELSATEINILSLLFNFSVLSVSYYPASLIVMLYELKSTLKKYLFL